MASGGNSSAAGRPAAHAELVEPAQSLAHVLEAGKPVISVGGRHPGLLSWFSIS